MKKKGLAVLIALVLLCGIGIAATAVCAQNGWVALPGDLQNLFAPRQEPNVTFEESDVLSPNGAAAGADVQASLTGIMQVSNAYFDAHPDCTFLLAGYGEGQEPYLSDSGSRLILTEAEKQQWETAAGLMKKAGFVFGSVERREGYFLFCADAEPYAIVYAENDRKPPQYLFKPDEEQKSLVFKLADHWYEVSWY